MKKLLISLALAYVAIAAPVAAQTLPASIIIVNMDRVINTSAAGKQAQAELKARNDAIQARLSSLRTSMGAEERALASSRPSSPGPESAAWQTKVKEYTTRKTMAEKDLSQRNQEIQSSRQYVLKQINEGARPIIAAVMKERGATITLAEGATLQHAANINVTAEVIARLDKSMPRVSTTIPASGAVK